MRFLYIFLLLAVSYTSIFSQKPYFYTGKDYGSEALFNPLSLIINGGFDITQLQSVDNRIGIHQYGKMANVVFRNLAHPFENIKRYGWPLLVRTELLPLSFRRDELQWIPNYQQHLIGGGMLYTRMKEWYEYHNIPYPWLMSSLTLMTHHLLNEVMESGPNEGWSVDEVTDIYLFDLGGIILFSFDDVNEFFSKELNLADWSLQAAVSMPNGRVNAGQYFAIKWKLPYTEDWSLFYRYGMGALFGLSKKINPEDAISVGLGFKTKHLIDVSSEFRQRTIETGWFAGIFYDKNNSLMSSLVLSGVKEFFCMADIYPGIIKYKDFSPGIWAVFGRNGNTTIGIATKWAIGFGYETRQDYR